MWSLDSESLVFQDKENLFPTNTNPIEKIIPAANNSINIKLANAFLILLFFLLDLFLDKTSPPIEFAV
jgi:hypothetical protein